MLAEDVVGHLPVGVSLGVIVARARRLVGASLRSSSARRQRRVSAPCGAPCARADRSAAACRSPLRDGDAPSPPTSRRRDPVRASTTRAATARPRVRGRRRIVRRGQRLGGRPHAAGRPAAWSARTTRPRRARGAHRRAGATTAADRRRSHAPVEPGRREPSTRPATSSVAAQRPARPRGRRRCTAQRLKRHRRRSAQAEAASSAARRNAFGLRDEPLSVAGGDRARRGA